MKLFVVIAFIALAGGSLVAAQAVKSSLIARGHELLVRADIAARELERTHGAHEVSVIRTEEAKIRRLITELELATATMSITHLEHDLSAAEQQLTYELEKINHRPAKRDTRSDLIVRATALRHRAEEAIRSLEARHLAHEVAIIRVEETKIRRLVTELELATTTTSMVQLEHEVAAAEHQLTFELEKINHRPAKRDTRSDLIVRATALRHRAEEAIRSLEARHLAHEVAIIRVEETKIRRLVTELELATPTSSMVLLEHELSAAEHQLTFELEKINHH